MTGPRTIVTLATAAAASLTLVLWTAQDPQPSAIPDAAPPAPGEWLSTRRMSRSALTQARLARINADYQRLREQSALRARGIAAADWTFVGPVTIGGRVLDIAIDPVLDDTLYVASASGGVWASADAGDTFTSAWPDSNAQAIGALAMTSTGLLYAGTGESGPGGGSPTFGNKGVFVSSDRGANWSASGLQASERISRIAIDPANEQRLFVAATGPLFAPGGERGVYRSDDGGATWQLVLAGDNDTTGASDVHLDPLNPDRVYAVLWDHLREPALRRYGGPGSGIYRSLDGGDSWTRLAGGLPPASPNVGRIALGVAPSNPDRLYATYIDTIGRFTASYTSSDGGDSWTVQPFNQNLANSQSSFGWWFARIWVDPLIETKVYSAGIDLLVSNNAGASWQRTANGVHVDQHAMAWDDKVNGRIYLGNDGGVYRSDSDGVGSWTFATVQPFTQFYTLDVSEQDPTRLVGGTQDNNCLRSYSAADPDDWNAWGCGDGLENLINPVDQNLIYGCSQYGSCIRSLNGGETALGLATPFMQRNNWQSPLLFDPTDPSTMYYAGNRVARSIDGGASWSLISPDLTGGDPFPNPIDPYPFGTVTTIGVAKSDPAVIYAGTDDARIWVTRDGGTNWVESTDPALPDRWVTKLLVSDTDADLAWLSFSGFRNDDDTPYLFVTTDGGTRWTDITGNLPEAPINTLARSTDGALIVGSDIGIFISADGGAQWDVLGQGLPQVPVTDLRVHVPSATLYASTFGRGIWQLPLGGADSDADGITDDADNCILTANANQRDTNGDGFGNLCDADLNDDCIVDVADFLIMRAVLGTDDADADLDGNGIVGRADLRLLLESRQSPPGPSGITDICEAK